MIQEAAPLRQEDQFRELLGVLRRRKTIVVLTTLFFLLLGVTSVLLSPASYMVVSRVLILDYAHPQGGSPSDPVDLMTKAGQPMEIGAQIGMMGSPAVLSRAFAQAQVQAPSTELAEAPIAVNSEAGGPILDVVVNWPDPSEASRLAQAIPDVFNDTVKQDSDQRAAQALVAAKFRLKTTQAALKSAELTLNKELIDQGPNHELVTQGGSEGSERSARLSGYQQQLDAAKIGLATAETQLQESITARDALPKLIRDTRRSPTVDLIRGQKRVISDVEGQIRATLVTQTEGSPELKVLRARLAHEVAYLNTLPKIDEEVTPTMRNPDRLSYDQKIIDQKISIQASKVQIAKIQAKVDAERAGLADYERRLPHQHELQGVVDAQRATTANAAQYVSALEALIASDRQKSRVLSLSSPGKTQPVVTRTIVSSVLLGLVFGVVLALLRDRFDNRVYTLEQIYDVSGAVPIGTVSTSVKALGPNVGGQNRNRVLESYRSLRFNLESSAEGGPAQSVLVASASAGEGRAGLSLNLATEAATDARKTILVDADMRTPELHDVLKLSRGPGLSEVLSGTVGLDEALQPTSQPNMLFLSAGAEHGLPLELLTGPSFAALHEALKERADVIVLNSPSLMRYTDGRAIAKIADSVLFVAKRGFTRRDAMRYCIGMLRRTKARLLGVVLSDDAGRPTDVPYYATE